jgi:hypothetical protein
MCNRPKLLTNWKTGRAKSKLFERNKKEIGTKFWQQQSSSAIFRQQIFCLSNVRKNKKILPSSKKIGEN